MGKILTEISQGELLDKITILEIKLKEILSQSFENIEYEFLIKNNSNKELLDMLLPLHEKHTQTFTYERLVSGLDNA